MTYIKCGKVVHKSREGEMEKPKGVGEEVAHRDIQQQQNKARLKQNKEFLKR